MDQNFYQQSQPFTPQPMIKNAAYYRARARKALKGFYGVALVAFLLASILGGAATSSGGFSFNFNPGSDSSMTEKLPAVLKDLWSMLLDGRISEMFTTYPTLVLLISIFSAAVIFSLLFSLFVGAPVTLGYQRFQLNLMDEKDREVGVLFRYFKTCYGKSVVLYLLYNLITLAASLPMLAGSAFVMLAAWNTNAASDHTAYIALLIVAMLVFFITVAISVALLIVLKYRYAYCFMILAEYPEISVIDALRNSAVLMKGNKWRLFCLELSFIGWYLLLALVTCCTCGIGSIGSIFLAPYVQASLAAFYDDIANRCAAKEAEFPSLDPNDYDPNGANW